MKISNPFFSNSDDLQKFLDDESLEMQKEHIELDLKEHEPDIKLMIQVLFMAILTRTQEEVLKKKPNPSDIHKNTQSMKLLWEIINDI